MVELDGMILPEFSRSRRIDETFVCFVANPDTLNDVILGNDFLQAIGIICNGHNNTITWFDTSVPYKPRDYFDNKDQMYVDFLESLSPTEGFNDDEEHESNIAQILEAKFQKTNIKQVAENAKHLTVKQREQLATLLSSYNKLFSGELGLYPHR
jgi:hypothetical protein